MQKVDKEADEHPSVSLVDKVRNIRWTSRQLVETTYYDYIESKQRYVQSNSLITKLLPGSRRQDLLGLRGLRDLVSLNMISDNLFLVRFRGSNLSQTADYWTVISSHGQVQPIPEKARKHLIWSNFSAGDSRISRFDTNVVLYGGHERVISFGSDVRFKEKHITKIQFTRQGEVGWITQYKKDSYEDKLRQKITEQLMQNQELRRKEFRSQGGLTEFKAKMMADTLQYQPTILSRHSGDLYRIASIVVDDSFTDDAIVNPLGNAQPSGESAAGAQGDSVSEKNSKKDILQLGIFEVERRKKDTNENTLTIDIKENYKLLGKWRGVDDVSFSIVLFLCSSERERFHLEQAGFTLVCNQICWTYPTEPIVHVLDVRKIHEAKEEQSKRGIGALLAGVQSFGNVFQSGIASKDSLTAAPTEDAAKEKHGQLPARAAPDEKDDDFKRERSSSQGSRALRASKSLIPVNESDEEDNSIQVSEEAPPAPEYQAPNVYRTNEKKDDLFKSSVTPTALKKQGTLGATLLALKAAQIKKTQVAAMKLVHKVKEKQTPDDDTETASDEEDEKNMYLQTRILWKLFSTYTIDLSVMCDNENDKFAMHLSEMPQNMTYSLDNQEQVDFSIKEPTIHENMLQITVKDRIAIFDVGEEIADIRRKVKEIHVFNASQQFIKPEKFVESGFDIIRAYEDPTKTKDGFLVDRIIQNRCKELCFSMQTRLNLDSTLTKKEFEKLPQTPICLSIFKKYAEIDLMELKRIQDRIDKHGRLDNIDFQTTLSTFKGHSAFSIFSQSEKFHEQILSQVLEGEWLEEEQEDETFLENNEIKRLYRVLTTPTPEMNPNANLTAKDKQEQDALKSSVEEKQVQENASSVNKEKEGAQDQKAGNSVVEGKEDSKTPEKKISFGSVLRKSIYSPNARIKACLLSIVNKCAECTITTFCSDQDAFGELIKDLSSNAIELIADSFVNTPFTRRILNTSWHPDMESVVTMRTNNSLITQEQVDKRIQAILKDDIGAKESEQTKTQVEVRLLDLSWLLADKKTFVHFTTVLDLASNDQIYTTELLKTLLVEFWEENFSKILRRCLLPWLGYALCTMGFFVQALRGEREDSNRAWITILGIMTLVGLGYQIFIEVRQSKNESFLAYVSNIVNLMDMFQYFSTMWIVIVQMIGLQLPGRESQRVIAAVSTLFLWIKVLDWCQLFAPTSFFIKLITETIYDIRHFFLIFLVALFMFGVPMYILQLNREEETAIVEDKFSGIWLLNAFYNQYMLSLGEFTIDAFDDEPQVYLCYIFFLSATFFTQITFLNMLIALMGDTYGKVMESQETYQLLTQRSIMGDYTALIDDPVDPDDFRPFLFIIQQKLEGDSDPNAAWEGNLTVIKKAIENGLNGLQKQLDKKLLALDQGIKASSQRDVRFDKESRGQYVKIMEKFASVDKKFEQIDPEKTDKIFDIVSRQQVAMRNITTEMKADNSEGQQSIQKNIHKLATTQDEANQDLRNELKELKESQKQLIEAQAQQAAQQKDQAPAAKEKEEEDEEDLKVANEEPPAALKAVQAPAAQPQPAPVQQVVQQVEVAADTGSKVIPQSAEDAQAQSERLESAIAASQRATDQVVTRLGEQQQSLLQEVAGIKGQQTVCMQAMSDSHDQLSGKLNETQNEMLQQLQAMQSAITQLQRQQEQLASQQQEAREFANAQQSQTTTDLQNLMGSLLEQMTSMQEKTQQEVIAANQQLKKEIIEASVPPDDF